MIYGDDDDDDHDLAEENSGIEAIFNLKINKP